MIDAQLRAIHETLLAISAGLADMPIDSDMVGSLVGQVRQVERDCVGLLVELGHIAKQHVADGSGAPVEVVLGDQDKVTSATARADVARTETAARFPRLGAEIRSGLARPENVDVLARLLDGMTPEEVGVLTEQDAVIAEAAGRLNADSFRRRVQRMRDRIRQDHGDTAARQAAAETNASTWVRRDRQTWALTATFDALQGEVVHKTLANEKRRLAKDLGSGHQLTSDQIAAQALTDLIVRGGNTEPTQENNRPLVYLDVICDHRTLTSGPHEHSMAETGDGVPINPDTLSRLACDCVIRRVETLLDGRVNVSRSSRTATRAQRSALRALYPCCPISGAPWSQIEIHHVEFVTDGGETVLHNLVPISRRWHHLLHDENWRLEMDPDRTLRLFRPGGRLHRELPPPANVLTDQDTQTLAA